MAKTARDLTDKIAELAEELKETSAMQIRNDLAAELIRMSKGGRKEIGEILNYANATFEGDNSAPYLPMGAASEDIDGSFLRGLRFAAALLKDKKFEY